MMTNSLKSMPQILGPYVELESAIPSYFESRDHV